MKNKDRFTVIINGKSGSGKTTLIKKIIPVFIKKGYRVGALKHSHHDFEIDKPGKDSWLFQKAGACMVVISSSDKFAFIKKLDQEIPLKETVHHFFQGADIVFVEGYRKEDFPRIEVISKETVEDEDKVFSFSCATFMIVSEKSIDVSIPVYHPKDIDQIVGEIEGKLKIFYNSG